MLYSHILTAPTPKTKQKTPEHMAAIKALKVAVARQGIVMVTAEWFNVPDVYRQRSWTKLANNGVLRASGDWGIGEHSASCPTWYFCIHLEEYIILMKPTGIPTCSFSLRVRGEEFMNTGVSPKQRAANKYLYSPKIPRDLPLKQYPDNNVDPPPPQSLALAGRKRPLSPPAPPRPYASAASSSGGAAAEQQAKQQAQQEAEAEL